MVVMATILVFIVVAIIALVAGTLSSRIGKEYPSWMKDSYDVYLPMTYLKYGLVLFCLLVVAFCGILLFGFIGAGSYDGYDAGSVFRPAEYEEVGHVSFFGVGAGAAADVVNKHIRALRMKNLFIISLFALLMAVIVIMTVLLDRFMADTLGFMGAKLSADSALSERMLAKYEERHGKYKRTSAEKNHPLRFWQFVMEFVLSPDCTEEDVDRETATEMWTKLYANLKSPVGRLFMALDGLRLNDDGELIRTS